MRDVIHKTLLRFEVYYFYPKRIQSEHLLKMKIKKKKREKRNEKHQSLYSLLSHPPQTISDNHKGNTI